MYVLRIHRGKYRGIQTDRESSATDNSLSYQSVTNDNQQLTMNRRQISDKSRQSLGKRLNEIFERTKSNNNTCVCHGNICYMLVTFFYI